MRMCGATNSFIRWPFIFEGLILGLLGAVVAFFIQWGIYSALYQAVAAHGALSLFPLLPFASMWKLVLGVFALAGALIGACGSGLAIRRFLRV